MIHEYNTMFLWKVNPATWIGFLIALFFILLLFYSNSSEESSEPKIITIYILPFLKAFLRYSAIKYLNGCSKNDVQFPRNFHGWIFENWMDHRSFPRDD